MKTATILSLVFGLTPAFAAICNNNCGRQVAGVARKDPPFALRSSLCADLLTTYTTIVPGTVTVTATPVVVNNVHAARAEIPAPIITGTKPAYASSCPDVTAYWSACHCFEDIAATTVTVTGPAQTVIITPTLTVQPSFPTLSSRTSSWSNSSFTTNSSFSTTSPSFTTSATATSSALPTCTEGIEFALYNYGLGTEQCSEVSNKSPRDADFRTILEGVNPWVTGTTSHMWFSQDDAGRPLSVYGVEGPPGSGLACSALMHRGYIKPSLLGTYTIYIDYPDDFAHVWVGEVALSGSFSAANSQAYGRWPDSGPWVDFRLSYIFEVTDTSAYIPFRVFWADRHGPGSLRVTILDATGSVILGGNSQSSPNIVTSCEGVGSPAPAWLDWLDEVVGE
ncbi:uncharacterized protein ColSpa_11272 [Colletotrichum spaethianum]|uniref:GLEYA adhesin domain-containing protein n=1 Tax=Colletotrichum spaethianum TaxID=700344 RepID=A0AA37UL42_9PEZI|nr:uncharacterized protein ColSpa_11272 [Colletotrichum spaethianum]GKT51091.1 hypothetical protein ColSpa_11272 [Colletotrichum spaethianum]